MTSIEQSSNRLDHATQLVEDFNLRQDAEFFEDPSNRVEFLKSLDFDDFSSITEHINARTRGYEPRERLNAGDLGATLPMMKTPVGAEKPDAYKKGFDVISNYLQSSSDSDEQKLRAAGMATEALIVWVHPFNDGNGRTSRFLGKFIEDGSTDTEQLIAETADRNERMRMYPEFLRVDNTVDLDHMDLILDEDEIAKIKAEQEALPITDGISLSLERFLSDKELQDRIENKSAEYKEIRQKAMLRKNEAA